MTRRAALASFALLSTTSLNQNFLLISQSEIDAAKRKTEREPWARAALERLLQSANQALVRPLNIPDRGGQWGHWYSCAKDGVELRTESPTRHVCPLCGAVYSGEPYDSVYLTRVHFTNCNAMRDMALAFRFTGKHDFATKTKELLLAYAAKYLTYARHDNNGKDTVNAARITSQTLDESVWTIPATWAYCLIADELERADRETIASRLLRPATETIIGPSYDALSNIQCWKDSAVACVGFALNDQRLISIAMDNPLRGFHVLMQGSVLPGGIWKEGSLGYHHYVLSALGPLAEAARHNGLDLYADTQYHSLFDAPIALALPNAETPGFNDNAGGSLKNWTEVYELAFARWGQPEYGRVLNLVPRTSLNALLYGVSSIPAGDPVPKTSVVLREAGFANLRAANVSVAARFGKHGGGHGHPDMLNIVTFAYGSLFGVDPGSINYGVPLHKEWYRSTVAHNTVSVDELLQSPADGRFVDWSANADSTKLIAEANVYEGVHFERALVLAGDSLIDTFTCEAGADHTYDWVFHSQGDLAVSVPLASRAEPIGQTIGQTIGHTNGYQHIRQAKQGQADGDWTATWSQKSAKLTLSIGACPGTTIFTGVGPGRNPAEMVPLLVIRRKALKTTFAVRHTYSNS